MMIKLNCILPPTASIYIKLLPFSILIALSGCDNDNSNNTASKQFAENTAQETQALTQPDNLPSKQAATNNNLQSEPTADDMVALAGVMHGAVNQQPNDAPKDKYGKPYIIGNLGGFAVNLPSSVVDYVEYNDSPGWDMNAVRNYQPPVRDYDSVLKSFGFDMRISDGELLDGGNSALLKSYKETKYKSDKWVSIGISSGSLYGTNKDWLDDMLEEYFNPQQAKIFFNYYSRKLSKTQFGLEVYVNDNIDSRTGKPLREDSASEDLFIKKNEEGSVITYITCSNNDVPTPPCTHHFYFPEPMKVEVSFSYSRKQLSHWQQIEQMAIDAIEGFRIEPIVPLHDVPYLSKETQ